MTEIDSLPKSKKLLVQFRLEPGCLGPEGTQHIGQFCVFAQKEFESFNDQFVSWEIMPRIDKSLAEIEYRINGKRLGKEQVSKYLRIFKQDLTNFEEKLEDKLAIMIDLFFSR